MSPKTKKYALGENRFLLVKKNGEDYCISITDTKTQKSAEFSVARWASFTRCFDSIDENVNGIRERKNIVYSNHIGGGWHVSVTTGIWCVDIRKFYQDFASGQLKPTKTGIALRLHEWATLKDAVANLHTLYPDLATTIPCYLALDHADMEVMLQCRECSPYLNILASSDA
jgi:hypothetical protein